MNFSAFQGHTDTFKNSDENNIYFYEEISIDVVFINLILKQKTFNY